MRISLIVSVLALLVVSASADSTFSVSATATATGAGKADVTVAFRIPEGHHIYANRIKVEAPDNIGMETVNFPVPVVKLDPTSGENTGFFESDVVLKYLVAATGTTVRLKVGYQGCSKTMCFLPVTKEIVVPIDHGGPSVRKQQMQPVATVAVPVVEMSATNADWQGLVAGFRVVATEVGYMSAGDFAGLLDHAGKTAKPFTDRLAEMFEQKGVWMWVALLLILVGGAGLNLTPCVLPMIPINIAIIGAGVQSGASATRHPRARGFLLGAVYGSAMAFVYGVLGLVVVLAGKKMGVLNSSVTFNVAIAIVFLLLSLGMFNIINIDLSRFQGSLGTKGFGGGSFVAAFLMGGVAALLAGSCIAPVVASVLLVSANLYAKKIFVGLLLPFLLGFGMGLPWPFLGAGLSFLPKPGRWMERVKYGFGVIILVVAVYYGHLAYSIHSDRRNADLVPVGTVQLSDAEEGWEQSLSDGLTKASRENKPVLIDFWATWCKSCVAMNATTFKDANVRKRLAGFVGIRQKMDNLDDPANKSVMDHFKVIGLPTYVVLVPEKE